MNATDRKLSTLLNELPDLVIRFNAAQPRDPSRISDRQIDKLRDAKSALQIHLSVTRTFLPPLVAAIDRLHHALERPEPVELGKAMVGAMDALHEAGFSPTPMD